MTNQILFFFFALLIVVFTAALSSWLSLRQSRKTLERCSDLLQQIFLMVEERSTVTRILSQETLDQELERLKALLENRSEAILVRNEALENILEGLPDGLIAIDQGRSILFCNQEACRLVGIPQGVYQGRKLFEILRHRIPLGIAEQYLNTNALQTEEVEFLSAKEKMVRMRLVPLQKSHSVKLILVFSDVSMIKKLETMRRDFVANVSHELRTPLTSIQGFVETLLEGAGEEASTRNRFLELMQRDVNRLRRLIEDLLLLSKIENHPRSFEMQPINLASELNEVLELFALKVQQKQISLIKKINQDIVLSANQDQLRQVWVNLIDNAVKFTPALGSILVTANQNKNTVEIRIADTGPGIHPDNHKKIFQRFFREDHARSRETGGTGLGLAIVKHIVEAHRGRVYCEANPTGGTVFVVTFSA